jgi:hypothetical protein
MLLVETQAAIDDRSARARALADIEAMLAVCGKCTGLSFVSGFHRYRGSRLLSRELSDFRESRMRLKSGT